MYKYCKNKDILQKGNPIWAHFRVEKIVEVRPYKKSKDYQVEIAGSSKSVCEFYNHIFKEMHENIDYTEEDNWFEDNVTWPKRYIKAMRHNHISLGNFYLFN